MKIDLRRLEHISKITIPQEKEEIIKKDIEEIIAYTNIIKKTLEISKKSNHIFAEESRYRVPSQSPFHTISTQEIIFNNAPQKKYTYFQVPALITRKA